MLRIDLIAALAVILLIQVAMQESRVNGANLGPQLTMPSQDSLEYLPINETIIGDKDQEINNNIAPQRTLVRMEVPIERASAIEKPVAVANRAGSINLAASSAAPRVASSTVRSLESEVRPSMFTTRNPVQSTTVRSSALNLTANPTTLIMTILASLSFSLMAKRMLFIY